MIIPIAITTPNDGTTGETTSVGEKIGRKKKKKKKKKKSPKKKSPITTIITDVVHVNVIHQNLGMIKKM